MKDLKAMKDMKEIKDANRRRRSVGRLRRPVGSTPKRRLPLKTFMSFKTFMIFTLTFPAFVPTWAIGLR